MTEKLNLKWWKESTEFPVTEASGTQFRQLTNAPALTINVYCEQPYCSADGNRLALVRYRDTDPEAPAELLVYDIATYRVARLQRDVYDRVACAAYTGHIYATVREGDRKRVVHFDLNTLEREELFEWGDNPGDHLYSVSPDGRYGLCPARLEGQNFGIIRVEMKSGRWQILRQGPDVGNPHLQFQPGASRRILALENRGALFDEFGNLTRLAAPGGNQLYSMDYDGNDVRYFPATVNGSHQCWIGDGGHVLGTRSPGEGICHVMELSPEWEEPRVIFETDKAWNHVSASKCGRYFVADCYYVEPGAARPTIPLLLGSIRTGKTRVLADSQTSGGGSQFNHAHPYITSDNRWVVFNSNRTGLTQVYIASIPEGFLEELDA
jgi:hypothetical protein